MSVELAVVADNQSKQKDDNPYEEYMWMGENELEFEQNVLAQLEEEELMQNCFQDMLEEEELGLFSPPPVPSATSSSTTSTSSSSLPPIENLSIGTTNGVNGVHHGNGDVILMPASEVAYDAGGGGDGQHEERRKETDSCGKNENLSDSDSSEGCPQR